MVCEYACDLGAHVELIGWMVRIHRNHKDEHFEQYLMTIP